MGDLNATLSTALLLAGGALILGALLTFATSPWNVAAIGAVIVLLGGFLRLFATRRARE